MLEKVADQTNHDHDYAARTCNSFYGTRKSSEKPNLEFCLIDHDYLGTNMNKELINLMKNKHKDLMLHKCTNRKNSVLAANDDYVAKKV